MKLLNCALVALALSGTGCGSQSPVSPQVLQVSGTVRYPNGTAVGGAVVSAVIGSNTRSSSTQADPAGHFVIVVPGSSESVTLWASPPPPPPGSAIAGSYSGFVHVGGRPGRIMIDIVLDLYVG